jgi:hypothetical protein
MVQLSDAETKKWLAAANPVIEEWIKKNEAKGLPAKKLVDFIRKRAEHYGKMSPEQIMRETIEAPVAKFIGG